MLVTIWIALGTSGPLQSKEPFNPLGFKLSGFSLMFSTVSLLYDMHPILPSELSGIRNKSRVGNLLVSSFGTGYVFSFLISFFSVWYFNKYVYFDLF